MGQEIWIIIAGMAIVTFVPRVIPFFVIDGEKLPPVIKEWLRLLPIVIFAGMVAPPLFTTGNSLNPAQNIDQIIVVLTGAVVAYFTKKIPLSLGTAVIVLLLINFIKLS